MRVLIVEPDLTGHHSPYLRHLLCSLAELGQEAVVLTCRGASQTPQFALHLQDVSAQATWDESLEPDSKLPRNAAQLFRALVEAVNRHHAEHVWVPYADFETLYLGARAFVGWKRHWPAGVQAEGLIFRGNLAYPAPRWHKNLNRIIAKLFVPKANWEILHFLDPIPYEYLCREYPEQSHRYRLMPDPVEKVVQETAHVARARLRIPVSGRYVGCIGVLVDLCAIGRVLSAFRQAGLGDENRLLLAGPMAESVRALIDHDFGDLVASGRVICLDRHLNLDEVALAVMATDVVCIPTKFRVGSSSFLIRAATAGRAVVADDFGWTGWIVRKFDLGWTVDVRNISAFAEALRSAIENAGATQFSPAAERFVRYHSAENFKAHWTSGLRERLGLSPDPNLFTWQSVLHDPVANRV
jgi:glycosyltransferase involved in cell wall biosynthesis